MGVAPFAFKWWLGRGTKNKGGDWLGKTLSPLRATTRPYQINGVWHYPQQYYELDEIGLASYYGGRDGCHGLPTATGERFDMYGLTAAHKKAHLPSIALITNLENGRSIPSVTRPT